MIVAGRNIEQMVPAQPVAPWEKNMAFLAQIDVRLAMNYAAKADTGNGFRRLCNSHYDSEEVGAAVFDAFYAPGRERKVGCKVGSLAYPRCSVVGDKMFYTITVNGAKHNATQDLPF